jgi:carbamoyltransferase
MREVFLGVHYGHNATVAVVKQGRLVFCQSEERINRIKNSTGFPHHTISYIYKNVCSPGEVVSATLFGQSILGYEFIKRHNFDSFQYGFYLSPEVPLGSAFSNSELKWNLSQWRARTFKEKSSSLKSEAEQYFADSLHLPSHKVRAIGHHQSHALSAAANVNQNRRTLIFTLDAVGDYQCASVNLWEGGALNTLQITNHRNSLGYFYSATTALLGMRSGEHEFKVMGLAPYANPKYFTPILEKLRRLLWLNSEGQFVAKFPPTALKFELEKIYRFQRFDNVAGAIQQFTEELTYHWVDYWVKKTGCDCIALAGGVFMNVKACQKILTNEAVSNCFVVPSSADESTAIGAAFSGFLQDNSCSELQPIRDLYLGVEYTNNEISAALADVAIQDRYEVSQPDNLEKAVAQLLAQNEVVARFAGAMEFGARALGNRSILANPNSFSNVERINSAIKSRDFWMPFTPSILEEDVGRYIIGHQRIYGPYMCITYDTTEEAQRDLPAAIHPRDKTARPQSVNKDWNPKYHSLISEFKELTGIGAVLNTSFNLHGEPNVCSPKDAIHTVDNSGLEFLAIGDFLLQKK